MFRSVQYSFIQCHVSICGYFVTILKAKTELQKYKTLIFTLNRKKVLDWVCCFCCCCCRCCSWWSWR